MNRNVFPAILAMDSYNRGEGASSTGLPRSGSIGNSQILNVDLPAGSSAAGFSATAYTVSGVDDIADGTTVISYRGTNFDLKGWRSSPAVKDITNGWSLFTGFVTDRQAKFSEQFFRTVTGFELPMPVH